MAVVDVAQTVCLSFDYTLILGAKSGRAFIDCDDRCELTIGELEGSLWRTKLNALTGSELALLGAEDFNSRKPLGRIIKAPPVVQHYREPPGIRVRALVFPYDLLKAIRRGTSGQDYRDLRSALTRLAGTLVRTNIRATERRKTAVFHWLEGWNEIIDEVRQESKGMTMTLPQWLYHGVLQQGGVLTIDPDYFLLTGGLERWMYRVARKTCRPSRNRLAVYNASVIRKVRLPGSVFRFCNRYSENRKGRSLT